MTAKIAIAAINGGHGWRAMPPAQRAQPRDPLLQYLAAVMCVRLSLWGKAQHLLRQCIATTPNPEIKSDAQRILASLAQRND